MFDVAVKLFLPDVPTIFTQKVAGNFPIWPGFGTLQSFSNGTNAGAMASSQYSSVPLFDVQE
jgi:hypothetical protein